MGYTPVWGRKVLITHTYACRPSAPITSAVGSVVSTQITTATDRNKMISCRRETALPGAKVEDWNWETILYEHYRSIFNHCE